MREKKLNSNRVNVVDRLNMGEWMSVESQRQPLTHTHTLTSCVGNISNAHFIEFETIILVSNCCAVCVYKTARRNFFFFNKQTKNAIRCYRFWLALLSHLFPFNLMTLFIYIYKSIAFENNGKQQWTIIMIKITIIIDFDKTAVLLANSIVLSRNKRVNKWIKRTEQFPATWYKCGR